MPWYDLWYSFITLYACEFIFTLPPFLYGLCPYPMYVIKIPKPGEKNSGQCCGPYSCITVKFVTESLITEYCAVLKLRICFDLMFEGLWIWILQIICRIWFSCHCFLPLSMTFVPTFRRDCIIWVCSCSKFLYLKQVAFFHHHLILCLFWLLTRSSWFYIWNH